MGVTTSTMIFSILVDTVVMITVYHNSLNVLNVDDLHLERNFFLQQTWEHLHV